MLLVDCLESSRQCDPRKFHGENFTENVKDLHGFNELRPEAAAVNLIGAGLANTQPRYDVLL